MPVLDAPRPWLDLFPPVPPREGGRARPPATGGAPPPRVARSPFAFQGESGSLSAVESLTYEPFYGLSEKPFSLSTDPKFIYHSTSHDQVMQQLVEALIRGDAVMVLTGEMGIGKTTLCRSLIEQLGRRTVTSFITNPIVSLDDVLKTALVDFGVVAREDAARQLAVATRQELAKAVGDFAASLEPLQASAVIVLDEAQNLPGNILEPLAALSEDPNPVRRVQIILVGQPGLAACLRRSDLRSLEKKVAVRCRLEPLTAGEIEGYVRRRLAVAGSGACVQLEEGAFAELFAATGGVPRLVNLVCGAALARGHELSTNVIDDRLIAASAASLDIAPVIPGTRRLARMAAMASAFIALMLVGAGAAAWVFRDSVTRLLR